MRRVLLLGASGFLGRHVYRALVDTAAVHRPGRAEWDLTAGSVDDLAARLRAVRPDAVVSCVGAVTGDAPHLIGMNTMLTARLVAAIAAGAPAARLIRLGSAAEYGPIRPGHLAAESDPAEPVSEYGVSQLAATRLVELAVRAGRIDGVVLRVFNPIGLGLPPESLLGRVVSLLRRARQAGADHITTGPLGAYRDFVDARDVAAAVVAALTAPTLGQHLLNVASGRAVPVREVVRQVADGLGFTGEVRETAPAPARSAGVGWTCGDISRAGREIGWAPVHPLAESLATLTAAERTPPPEGPAAQSAPLALTTVRGPDDGR